jgi:hypothetical protein
MIKAGGLAVACLAALLSAGCSSSGNSAGTTSCDSPNPAYARLRADVGHASTFAARAGTVHVRRTVSIDSVARQGCDVRVAVTDAESGRPPRSLRYLIHPNGSIKTPPLVEDLSHGVQLRLAGPTVPSLRRLARSRTLREHLTVLLTKGPRHQSFAQLVVLHAYAKRAVRVPAGRFSTVPLEFDRHFAISSLHYDSRTTEYLAPGVGPVKIVEQVTVNDRHSTRTDVLIKVKHGGIGNVI